MTSPGEDENIYTTDEGVTIRQFARKIAKLGKVGIEEEYNDIRRERPNSTIKAFQENPNKNRYHDVFCLDRGRILLFSKDKAKEPGYIHGNYVDGYKQKRAYICTQGPFMETYVDFWKMVWQEGTLVIVSLTKIVEAGKEKCGQYWPIRESKVVKYGMFRVQTKSIKTAQDQSYAVSHLRIENSKTGEIRDIIHLLYLHWPDFGTPVNSQNFLKFRDVINETQQRLLESSQAQSSGQNAPIIVHCSAGVGRTGTLVALDICIRQLLDTAKVDVPGVVRKIRQQRYLTVQKADQYAFLNLGIIEFAITRDLLHTDEVDLTGFLTGATPAPAVGGAQLPIQTKQSPRPEAPAEPGGSAGRQGAVPPRPRAEQASVLQDVDKQFPVPAKKSARITRFPVPSPAPAPPTPSGRQVIQRGPGGTDALVRSQSSPSVPQYRGGKLVFRTAPEGGHWSKRQ